jgi:hypothetical protein
VTVNGDNTFSTIDAGDTGPGQVLCGANSATVWYTYTPAADGNYTVTLCGSALDTYIAVLSSGCPDGVTAPTVVACNDDFCGLASEATFFGTAGTTYHIRVRGFGGAFGTYNITVNTAAPPPVNDVCTGALPAVTGANAGTNVGATTDLVFLTDCGAFGDAGGENDVYFVYTTGAAGTYEFNTCGSTLDTVVSVHSACPTSEANSLGCNDDSAVTCTGDLQSEVVLSLGAGQTVYIRVAGYLGATGAFTLNIIAPAVTTGACCTGGAPLPRTCTVTTSAACTGTFLGAGTTCDGANPRAPWSFNPPAAPVAQAGCCPANFNDTGGVTVQDIFDFLSAWNASANRCSGDPLYIASTDLSGDNCTSVQDIFDFLSAWNAGCN